MPCDSIILNRVELSLADTNILYAAIKRLPGILSLQQMTPAGAITFYRNGVPFAIRKGVLECRAGLEPVADEIKRAYSREVVERTAKRYGWTFNVNKQDTKGNARLTLSKEEQ